MIQRAVDSVVHGDADYVHRHWGDLNKNEYKTVRAYFGRTDAGKKVLTALDQKDIYIDFIDGAPEGPLVYGMSKGRTGKIFTQNTKGGKYWEMLDIELDSMEATASTGLHESLHSLGVRASRKAEALVRLEEMRAAGAVIDRTAMKQVLSDMKYGYDHLPWLSGNTSDSFPGLTF